MKHSAFARGALGALIALPGLLACADQNAENGSSDMSGEGASVIVSSAADADASSTQPPTPGVPGSNPLLAEWEGSYEGVPAFDTMALQYLEAAIDTGIERHLDEIALIASNEAPADFENTIAAMEDSGRDLGRVLEYYYLWSNNLSSPEFQAIEAKSAPKLSAYYTQILQNADLFARVQSIKSDETYRTLTAEQQRLVDFLYRQFEQGGATLDEAGKTRFATINEELAVLHTQFANNMLKDEEGYVTFLDETQLSGLPQSVISAAAAAAEAKDAPGQYAITNTRSSMGPFLTYSDERPLREKVWRNYYGRGDNNNDTDNKAIITKILQLRHERVNLLGYKNYASWRLEDRMAKTPDRAFALMESVWAASTKRVAQEVADMQALADADADGADITIAPWDYRYYTEKVRQAKYALDSDEVKKYLQLDNLRDAMFFIAKDLFSMKFTPVEEGSVPVFHPDVKVWEVTDSETDTHIGLWYLDPFAREGKRSGAWATSYRSQESFRGEGNVLASNNSNFIKGAEEEPVLISWDDANTLFHEFGHALHFLSSKVSYPTLNFGVRDYTEFQSQLLERWLLTRPVIDNYLKHVETGEPIPEDLVAKLRAAQTFNQGFATTEYLASALIDMKIHSIDPAELDPAAFERETLAALDMPGEIVMRHRLPHFAHIFSGEGYSAGYYGYMWADVLTSDAAEAFKEAPGGFYDEEIGERMITHLFEVGNAVDPAEAYRAFRGRDADPAALMRDRGFAGE